MLQRLRADILLLQEVHGQDEPGRPRGLRALATLLAGTAYAGHQLRSTTLAGKPDVERLRNLVFVIPPGWEVLETREIRHALVPPPEYRRVMASPPEPPRPLFWERPLLYGRVRSPFGTLHLLNAHFKSKRPSEIAGQTRGQHPRISWASAAGWAEGFFVSSMKRVGAALETRVVLDRIFADEPEAKIILGGDLNAESDEVPVVALRGEVDDHGNPELNDQQMYPLEDNVPADKRFSFYHHGRKTMLDHLLASRRLLAAWRGTEIHNEILRDESRAFATDRKYPAPDHAPVVAEFDDALLAD